MPTRPTNSPPDWVPDDHPTRAILARYDGKTRGPVEFGLIKGDEVHDVLPIWERLLESRLIGIGLEENGHSQLYVASDGRCFGSSEVHDAFYFCADTLKQRLRMPILRQRSRPMLRPDQPSVDLYGIEFSTGDPEVDWPDESTRTKPFEQAEDTDAE